MGQNGWLDLAVSSTYICFCRNMTFECNFGNTCWVFMLAMGVDSEASYSNDIIAVCKEFMKVLGTGKCPLIPSLKALPPKK